MTVFVCFRHSLCIVQRSTKTDDCARCSKLLFGAGRVNMGCVSEAEPRRTTALQKSFPRHLIQITVVDLALEQSAVLLQPGAKKFHNSEHAMLVAS